MRAWIAVVAALGACGGYQSSYTRATADARELIWAYDNRVQVTQGGHVVAQQRDWGDLPDVVGCVPRARAWASSASSRDGTGRIVMYTGLLVMLAGVAAGSYLALEDTDNTDQMLAGLGVMGGGLVFGLATVPTGAYLRASADTRAIDAVNVYNDERGGCAR